MTLEIAKNGIDLGIITRDAGPMSTFYGDVLGLPREGTVELPGIGTMHRFLAGPSVIKITEAAPKADAVPGGLTGATGLRYFTIAVTGLDAAAAAIEAAGHDPVVAPREIRPGTRIAMFADPDGNWVELLETTA